MKPAISVRNLSKCYKLGVISRKTLVDEVRYWWSKIRGKDPREHFTTVGHNATEDRRIEAENAGDDRFWALKDVSFDVQPGEVVGVIGKNGVGKSTLLKILTRITEPTSGEAIINGRVGSLLEVGTGFHPELTGRENIFMNGTILGMKKREVDDRFDEIVAFSELEQFIDTPVKRYSSGMYVRLAFAVAAHLDPEILLVDEVLAVGDAAFQKKCLGKIGEVAKEGRTVLFVSHNMQAIQYLCSSAILLDRGIIVVKDKAGYVTKKYLNLFRKELNNYSKKIIKLNDSIVEYCKIELFKSDCITSSSIFQSREDIIVHMEVFLKKAVSDLCFGFDLMSMTNVTLLRTYDTDVDPLLYVPLHKGLNIRHCIIPKELLNAGDYLLALRISIHNIKWIIRIDPIIKFTVILDHGNSPYWNCLNEKNRPGLISPILKWEVK